MCITMVGSLAQANAGVLASDSYTALHQHDSGRPTQLPCSGRLLVDRTAQHTFAYEVMLLLRAAKLKLTAAPSKIAFWYGSVRYSSGAAVAIASQ